MKKNEVRINNIIKFDDGSEDIVKVIGIYEKSGNCFVDWIKICGAGYFKRGNSLFEDFVAVKLTPEILKACGFNHRFDTCYGFDTETMSFEIWDSSLLFGSYGDFNKIRKQVNFLHELQNIFFVLNGYELNVRFKAK